MNSWRPIALGARRALIALGLVGMLCSASVFGLYWFDNSLNQQVRQIGSIVQQQRDEIQRKLEDLNNMRSHIQRYTWLQQQGLVGAGDRPLWVEELLASHRRLGLGGTISYQLLAPRAVAEANAASSAPGTAATAPAPATEPLAHDLQFEMREVHEGEVLALLEDYRIHVQGRFRVQSCAFTEPRARGMTTQCVLRFITVAPSAEAASAQ